ncbi:NAD(P)-binding domain-containing protein [Candidatus Uabimicrobium sp. HlEnr_7]|uniref:NAD(P)-binding domain-containing protein n=1 Tax=Candidatus Uabimicrobium helgolandensis TaxID=3095367 RepID=UPI003557987F
MQKKQDFFTINTDNGEYKSKFVIWAAGEYQYPKKMSFKGEHLCTHYSEITSFSDIKGEDCIVIGAYESGFDTTINLVKSQKKVILIDSSNYLDVVNSDSSYSLSPFTRDRIRKVANGYTYYKNTRVKEVEFDKGLYVVKTTNKTFTSKNKPINCTGFVSLSHVKELFDFKEGYPVLNHYDESTKTKNLFLVGPQVKHRKALFCAFDIYRDFYLFCRNILSNKNHLAKIYIIKKTRSQFNDDYSCKKCSFNVRNKLSAFPARNYNSLSASYWYACRISSFNYNNLFAKKMPQIFSMHCYRLVVL